MHGLTTYVNPSTATSGTVVGDKTAVSVRASARQGGGRPTQVEVDELNRVLAGIQWVDGKGVPAAEAIP